MAFDAKISIIYVSLHLLELNKYKFEIKNKNILSCMTAFELRKLIFCWFCLHVGFILFTTHCHLTLWSFYLKNLVMPLSCTSLILDTNINFGSASKSMFQTIYWHNHKSRYTIVSFSVVVVFSRRMENLHDFFSQTFECSSINHYF